jgi:hypothetical protein
MLAYLFAAAALATFTIAQQVQGSSNGSIAAIPSTPKVNSASASDFSCQTCADAFSECGIACLLPSLTWENIFKCQGYCKEMLCNGEIGKVRFCH